ncbi:MAG: hypothetical protein JWM86_15 [Thermoleophilia bacterium]|nr:hypothetical protein [Thermoleophilia bacterium]
MRYMQVIEAQDVHEARNAYIELLNRRNVALQPSMSIYVETVHRARQQHGSWLCYIAHAMQTAA